MASHTTTVQDHSLPSAPRQHYGSFDGIRARTAPRWIPRRGQEPHDSYTPTAAKSPGTASKERPRHQELSFDARKRGSPSLGLGAPGFTFISKFFKESIF
ncbi:hypothetical protein AgCh_029527 [Apium graveolens]